MTPDGKRSIGLAACGLTVFAVIAGAFWYFTWRPVRYVDPAWKFSIRFAPEWAYTGEGDGAVARAMRTKPVERGTIETGVISVFAAPIENIPDALAYRTWYSGFQRKSLEGFALVQEGVRTTPAFEAPWTLFIHRVGPDKSRLQVWQAFFVKGKIGYIVTSTAKPFDFESFRAEFEEAVDSFRLE